jgi:hypothetical protein
MKTPDPRIPFPKNEVPRTDIGLDLTCLPFRQDRRCFTPLPPFNQKNTLSQQFLNAIQQPFILFRRSDS